MFINLLEITNLTTYSKENQPTKTASAISKKYSSSENIFVNMGYTNGWVKIANCLIVTPKSMKIYPPFEHFICIYSYI